MERHAYLIGAPVEHDGLSPTILGYSLISTDENVIEVFLGEDFCCGTECRLSSRVFTLRHDFKEGVWFIVMIQ